MGEDLTMVFFVTVTSKFEFIEFIESTTYLLSWEDTPSLKVWLQEIETNRARSRFAMSLEHWVGKRDDPAHT